METLEEILPALQMFGAVNSLAQVVLKIASPGVPDFYQGTEMWDLSLVDPDNRRPVDYATRRAALKELQALERNRECSVGLPRGAGADSAMGG